MDRRSGHRHRMANYRDKRQAAGYRETVVWLHDTVRKRIDALVRSGQFQNRSEALDAAVKRFFEEKTI